MQLISLNSIVRSYIQERGLVLHDYFRILSIAIAGLKDISKDINVNSNVKAKEITINEAGSGILPGDAVEIIKVCIKNGDKIVGLAEIDDINPMPKRDSQGNVVKRGIESERRTEGITFIDLQYWWSAQVNDKGEFQGRRFGTPPRQPFNYQIFGDRLQLDTRLSLDCVTVIYQTSGVNISDINMVYEFADEVIKRWVDWRFEEANNRKGLWERQNLKKDYTLSKQALYSAIHGIGYEDLMKTIRDKQVLTLKN
jgi:hypothetical protein